MMEATMVEQAVQAALSNGATSINADTAQLLLNVIDGLRDELLSEVTAHGGTNRLCDALRAERDALRAELARRQALAAQAQPLVAQLTAERDALRAWRDAVPVEAIRESIIIGFMHNDVGEWFDWLDGAA